MKTALLFLVTLFFLSSCLKDEFEIMKNEQELNQLPSETARTSESYGTFEFKTTADYQIDISAAAGDEKPLAGVFVELYIDYPFNADGTVNAEIKLNCIFKGATDKNGILETSLKVPSYASKLYAVPYYIGLEQVYEVSLIGSDISIEMEVNQGSGGGGFLKSGTAVPDVQMHNGYFVLGEWNNYGRPDYLEPADDIISADFLSDVNASLPEGKKLPDSHPQYLADNNDASLHLTEEAEVWVTFVHEGAGWHNTLGYYTYPTDTPPASENDITDQTIIFPDVSYGSQALEQGNKVKLFYYDQTTEAFTATFPAGVSVGWFLIAQGWSSGGVGGGVYKHYSSTNLNVEPDSDLQKHNVLLFDEERELLLLAFEDIRRDISSCDQDFNDAVFYATLNPPTATDVQSYQPIDSPEDADNDGVSDVFDEYPTDPAKAFNNYYPSQNTFGSLVYEDLWPYRGDYDFNDLVIDYNFLNVTNADNKTVSIESKFCVRAIGASYKNGFGLSFNTAPNMVDAVNGQLINHDYINLSANGTEAGQSVATVIVFDNAYNALAYPGSGVAVNTVPQSPYSQPDTIELTVDFTQPLSNEELGLPPYNPFIIVDKYRGVEVHLPNNFPTDLIDSDSLGIGHDDSEPALEKYYLSNNNLPWAFDIPETFQYPIEKEDIRDVYSKFDAWAKSGGALYPDWYTDKAGYRNTLLIYNPQ